MSADLLALAERCEQAKKSSDILDTTIDETVNGANPAPIGGRWNTTPHYTSSIDAALTLVPGGYFWAVGHDNDGIHCSWCARRAGGGRLCYARTPALAICAAALRARAAQ